MLVCVRSCSIRAEERIAAVRFNLKIKTVTRRRDILRSHIPHSFRNRRKRNCIRSGLCGGFSGKSVCRKTVDVFLRRFDKIFCRRVFKVYNTDRIYAGRFSADEFFMVVLVQCAEKVCFVASVLFKSLVEFQMFKRNVHKYAAVKKHIAESVRFFGQPV